MTPTSLLLFAINHRTIIFLCPVIFKECSSHICHCVKNEEKSLQFVTQEPISTDFPTNLQFAIPTYAATSLAFNGKDGKQTRRIKHLSYMWNDALSSHNPIERVLNHGSKSFLGNCVCGKWDVRLVSTSLMVSTTVRLLTLVNTTIGTGCNIGLDWHWSRYLLPWEKKKAFLLVFAYKI